ncbi:hypothetical protein C8Q80DRAFT_647603 [Daedaleopsis nitida]|nr:hypothetical protein C8Q80DRAFT_647603 [Daedaleopsis nitida]
MHAPVSRPARSSPPRPAHPASLPRLLLPTKHVYTPSGRSPLLVLPSPCIYTIFDVTPYAPVCPHTTVILFLSPLPRDPPSSSPSHLSRYRTHPRVALALHYTCLCATVAGPARPCCTTNVRLLHSSLRALVHNSPRSFSSSRYCSSRYCRPSACPSVCLFVCLRIWPVYYVPLGPPFPTQILRRSPHPSRAHRICISGISHVCTASWTNCFVCQIATPRSPAASVR